MGAQKSQFTQSLYRPSTLDAQDELKEYRALKPHYTHIASYLKDIKENAATPLPVIPSPRTGRVWEGGLVGQEFVEWIDCCHRSAGKVDRRE